MMAYPLSSTRWLEFDIPAQAQLLRVLTNASVQDFSAPPTTREQPRTGWQYALEYQLLGDDGRLLKASQYHLRAAVIQSRDPETGMVQAVSWFGQSAAIPTITRTVQLPLESAEHVARRLRLRLATRDAAVQDVIVRVYMRAERTGYDQPYAWSRLSPPARERLCRPMVYSPELLSPMERQNLLRWDWTALAPAGDEGTDYQRIQFYQSAPDPDELPRPRKN